MTNNSTQAFGLEKINLYRKDSNTKIIDLRIGEPSISLFPVEVFDDLSSINRVNFYYPSHGDLLLRELVLNKYYHDQLVENIAITHGTLGAIDFIFRANLNSEAEILLPDPGFPPYTKLAEFSNAIIKKYSINLENNFRTTINWIELECLITDKTKILLLNSPHNPTGKILTDEDVLCFEEILNKYPKLSFIMDEVYRGLIYGPKIHYDFTKYLSRGYIVGSFSKVLPLQGARIGWVLTNAKKMEKLSPYFNNATGAMSSFGQEIVKSVLKKNLIYKKEYFKVLSQAKKILDFYRVEYLNPEGAFFVFIKYNFSDEVVTQELIDLGVHVVPGSLFGMNGINFIRVCFAHEPMIVEEAFTIIGKHWKNAHARVVQ